MKLEAHVTVAGTEHKLIHYDVALKYADAGSATFEVQADAEPKGVVMFESGYTVGQMHKIFIGYVDKATRLYDKHWKLHCREICHALKIPLAVSLQHCYLKDVLGELASATALEIITADGKPYTSLQASRFFSTERGDGYYALKQTARVFNIPDFAWWQTAAGQVWCGAWADSLYAANGDIQIDPLLFTKQQPLSATLPALPALRPGMVVNGKRLLFVRHTSDHKTVIRWKS
jgi:hypothetical protein